MFDDLCLGAAFVGMGGERAGKFGGNVLRHGGRHSDKRLRDSYKCMEPCVAVFVVLMAYPVRRLFCVRFWRGGPPLKVEHGPPERYLPFVTFS